jgi:hypothetical protein
LSQEDKRLKRNAYAKAYYHQQTPEQKERERIRLRNWKRENPDKVKKSWDKYRSQNYEKVLLKGARDSARRKGIEFNLELSDIIIPELCPVLGIPIVKNQKLGDRRDNGPSIDRRDNSLGYIRGNICVISWRANRLKWNGSAREFESILKYMRET